MTKRGPKAHAGHKTWRRNWHDKVFNTPALGCLRRRAWFRRPDSTHTGHRTSAHQGYDGDLQLSFARRLHAAGDQGQKLDAANGLDIEFVERTPDAYATQFNSGEFKVGGSASLLTVALADARGVKVKYLFNLFDFWGAVVTSRPAIKTVKDLEGKQLAAARSTTNYVMFEFFAKRQGVDIAKMEVVNTAPPGLVGFAIADRADAVQLWEPAYTLLKTKKPDIRTLDIAITKTWQDFAGGDRIPYLGVAAHNDWIEANQTLIPKLYATYKQAG